MGPDCDTQNSCGLAYTQAVTKPESPAPPVEKSPVVRDRDHGDQRARDDDGTRPRSGTAPARRASGEDAPARETVEYPFGTIKARMGAIHFLIKTRPAAGGGDESIAGPKSRSSAS